MTTQNIYNLGFSKCGTTSIWQFFSGFPPTQGKCIRTASGAIEFDLRRDLQENHKELLKEGGVLSKVFRCGIWRQLNSELSQYRMFLWRSSIYPIRSRLCAGSSFVV